MIHRTEQNRRKIEGKVTETVAEEKAKVVKKTRWEMIFGRKEKAKGPKPYK